MRTLLALVALAGLVATSAPAQTTPDFQSLSHLFDYDNKLPLDIQDANPSSGSRLGSAET